MELRTIVVDDEQLAREELSYLLNQAEGVTVIGQARDGPEALRIVSELDPDLVFLDVQMPGLTGFEVAREFLTQQARPRVVFVTAYDQHALEAFEVNAVDILLKPVAACRLEQVTSGHQGLDLAIGDRALEHPESAIRMHPPNMPLT